MSYTWRGALQWWDDWQLRVLVLGSLGLQWFLLLAAPMRKYALPRVLRTFIWLAYISSDPLAIYVLATLFNRHAKTSNFGGDTDIVAGIGSEQQSSILEVLWAPILLIYLGGQEGMSGYEIEDNKLWGRHTVTLVSQVAVALYAFYKSWPRPNDPKLLVVAVLLFFVGVISFSEKPWALKAKAKRLAAVSSGVQVPKKPSNWRERMNQFFFGASHCFTGTRKAQSNFSTNLAMCKLPENPIWVSRFFVPLISASRFVLLVFCFCCDYCCVLGPNILLTTVLGQSVYYSL
ncbi:uncharacterized protein [Triticum aestivum]|uniref:uncharacterized protein n=1 Tax=Triticum aestivum TaxID=4565 RepID=UPI001D0079E6|nr:uncharacterized protein LOC123099908 [Triticum aestivum]